MFVLLEWNSIPHCIVEQLKLKLKKGIYFYYYYVYYYFVPSYIIEIVYDILKSNMVNEPTLNWKCVLNPRLESIEKQRTSR